MVVARASGTDLASSLKQNTFLTLEVCPVGGSARDGGTERGPGTGGHKRALGREDTKEPPLLVIVGIFAMGMFAAGAKVKTLNRRNMPKTALQKKRSRGMCRRSPKIKYGGYV